MTQGGPGIIISKSDGLETQVTDLLTTRYGISNQRVIAAAVAACGEHVREARAAGRAEVLEEARAMLADLKRYVANVVQDIRDDEQFGEDYPGADLRLRLLADELDPPEGRVVGGTLTSE